MPDTCRLGRWLGHLLPSYTEREVYAPALLDLCNARRAHGTSAARFGLQVLLLWFDSWRMAIVHPADLFQDLPIAAAEPPKEPVAMLIYNFRHALRRLRREPAFTLAAVFTLALGVGANVAVFALVEAVLLKPLPYPNADELAIVNHRDERTGLTKEFIAIGDYVDMAERQRAFSTLATYSMFQATVITDAEPFRVGALAAGAGLLEMLGVQPVVGRLFTADETRMEGPPVAILGHALWESRFGSDPAVVGRSIRLNQTVRTIVGVAPPRFAFPPTADNEVIVPMPVPVQAPEQRKSGWVFAVGRVRSDRASSSADADLAAISREMQQAHPVANQGSMYFAVPLRTALVGNTGPALKLLLGAVVVVLLIACANVANLQLARSLGRRREFAVRMALGSGRGRLAGMLLVESVLLASLASALGIVLAHWGLRGLIALVPASVHVPGLDSVRLNATVLGYALLITMLTAVAFGTIAALTTRLESSTLVSARGTSNSRAARRATSGLVVAEIALAVVLLMGAGLILRSFAGLLAVDPGFNYRNVMTLSVQTPADRYATGDANAAFYAQAMESLAALPGVESVGAAAVMPLTGNNWTVPFQRADRPIASGERPPDVGFQNASGGFFQALEIPLIEGRYFDARDRGDAPPVVIISESLRDTHFPEGNAVGRMITSGDGQAEIVGVVGDIRRAGLRDEPRPDMYFPFEAGTGNQTSLFVRTAGDPALALNAMQARLRELEPGIIMIESQSMERIASESVRVTELVLWLLGVFAITALILAAVGIYGVMNYAVKQRTREIGTRMAVGATRGSIVWLVLRNGAAIALFGITIGAVVSLVAARSLESVLFGVRSSDPATLLAAASMLAGVTILASYVPAHRASTVDPARTLGQ